VIWWELLFFVRQSLRSVGGRSKRQASSFRGLFNFWMLSLRRKFETQGLETRSSLSIEQTRLSRFGLEMQVSCLCWEEPRTSHCWLLRLSSDTWETQALWISCSIIETRVSCLWEEARISCCWTSRLRGEASETRSSWAPHFGLQTQTSRVWRNSEEMHAWVLYFVSTEQIVVPASCIYCRSARRLCRHSTFQLRFTGCWEPPVTWSWGRGRWWLNWPSTTLARGSRGRHWCGPCALCGHKWRSLCRPSLGKSLKGLESGPPKRSCGTVAPP